MCLKGVELNTFLQKNKERNCKLVKRRKFMYSGKILLFELEKLHY